MLLLLRRNPGSSSALAAGQDRYAAQASNTVLLRRLGPSRASPHKHDTNAVNCCCCWTRRQGLRASQARS